MSNLRGRVPQQTGAVIAHISSTLFLRHLVSSFVRELNTLISEWKSVFRVQYFIELRREAWTGLLTEFAQPLSPRAAPCVTVGHFLDAYHQVEEQYQSTDNGSCVGSDKP